MSVNSIRNAFFSFLSKQFVSCVYRSVCKVWSVASFISYLNKDYKFSSFYDHSFFPPLKIDGYCCTQSMIDADIQHLYQEPRLPLGKHVKHLVRFDFITFCPGLKSLNVPSSNV